MEQADNSHEDDKRVPLLEPNSDLERQEVNMFIERVKDAAEAVYYGVIDAVYNHAPELWSDSKLRQQVGVAAGVAVLGVTTVVAYRNGWTPFE